MKQSTLGEKVVFTCYWGENDEKKTIHWYRKAYKQDFQSTIMTVNYEKGTVQDADVPFNLKDKVSKV